MIQYIGLCKIYIILDIMGQTKCGRGEEVRGRDDGGRGMTGRKYLYCAKKKE